MCSRTVESPAIAYVDIAITVTRFQHYEVDGDVAGYGGRIGGDWYYKDKQKTTDHRLVAISAPLQFAVTSLAPSSAIGQSSRERPCYELVSDAIKQGSLPAEKAGLLTVLSCSEETCPIAIASSSIPTRPKIASEPDSPVHSPGLRFTTSRSPSDSFPAETQPTMRYSSMK